LRFAILVRTSVRFAVKVPLALLGGRRPTCDGRFGRALTASLMKAKTNTNSESTRTEQHRPGENPLPSLSISVALVRQPQAPHYGPIRSAADVYELVHHEASTWDRERFLTLALDAANHPLGIETVAIGVLDSCRIHPREVMKALILANAKSFIAIHNHPSGDLKPSEADRTLTRILKEAGTLMDIALLDHIIVGPQTGFYSFQEHGEL
jgi:DNA repair protein RadC